MRLFLISAVLANLTFWAPFNAAHAASDLWLERHGFQWWELVFDHDGDGHSSNQEFEFGTDPLDADDRPYWFRRTETGASLLLANTPGVRYSLETGTDLVAWDPVPGLPVGAGGPLEITSSAQDSYRFYRLSNFEHLDTDNDGLLDFEELNYYGSDPVQSDTDGDGVDDGDEIQRYGTDPTYASPTGRGTIRGRVYWDEDRDPATQEHPGLQGWVVFLDYDRDGAITLGEPVAVSGPDGRFAFEQVDPGRYLVTLEIQAGWTQVFPSLSPPSSPDGYPDRAVAYLDSGLGPIPGPFGRNADPLPGDRLVLGVVPEPVELSVILGPPPRPPLVAPVGTWAHVDWLTLPQDSELTVAFDDEELVDGPGPDLAVYNQQQGLEQAELYLGSDETDLTFVTVITEAEDLVLDLAGLDLPQPIRYVKLKALDLQGSFPGFELFGLEALNYRPIARGRYDVVLVGGETLENLDFGVAGDDRPPRLFLTASPRDARVGDAIEVQVTATDDLGIASVHLTANGLGVTLDAELRGTVSPSHGGLLELVAEATDTAAQTSSNSLLLVIRNADGSRPDLSGLGLSGESNPGGPDLRLLSPAPGEILSAPTSLLGFITSGASAVSTWRAEYAPADLVNPEALDAPDADYVLLAQGTGPVFNGPVGTLPADTLPPGAYFLRLTASDLNSVSAYLGLTVGVRVDPLDLRPEIVLTSPTNDSTITYLTDIRGSIRTRQELREWSVEWAPLSQVQLDYLADPTPSWRLIAQGSGPVEDVTLATFDPTVLPNDTYVLRVSAWNRNGLGWAEPLVLQVTGNAKLGNFAVEFLDIDLPLSGIPVQLRRVYDSLCADRLGDFGYGWSLALQDADIRETVPQSGSGLTATPFRVGTRVYLNAPDGRRVGFTFEPEVGQASFLGTAWRARFRPDPGVHHTLSVPEGDTPFLSVTGTGEVSLFFLAFPWNPNTYILTDPFGTHYTYEQTQGLLEIEDSSGNRVTFSRNSIQHSGGPAILLERDPQGRITEVRDPEGHTWSYRYDANGDLAGMTYPGGVEATFGYQATPPHFLSDIKDPLQRPSQTIEYDESGRVTAIIDAAGHRREQSWDPGAFSGTFTDGRGNTTQLLYNERGNIVRRIDPLGGVTQWAYQDPVNPDRETSVTDPNGNTTLYAYDDRGNLLLVEYPARRHSTAYTYNERNRPLSIAYGIGSRKDYAYDDRGNLIRVVTPVGQWTLDYTDTGLPSSILDGAGGVTRFEYDGASRQPNRVIAPDGTIRHAAYNARGQVTRTTDALGATTTSEYDDLGRLVRQLDPAAGETRISYDPTFPTLPRTVTDRVGKITRYTYDSLGRLIAIEMPGMALTRYEYDADGNRTAIVDPLGNRTEFAYDALNRVVRETDPAGRQRQYTYDAAGNRIEAVDGNGRKRTFVYDTLNRLVTERWHDPTDDSVIRSMTFGYDRLNRMIEATDPDASLTLFWQSVPGGALATSQTTYPGLPNRILVNSFDAVGRRIQTSLTGAGQIRFTRDIAGWLRIATGDVNSNNRWRAEFWRNARGDLVELRRFDDLNGATLVGSTVYPDVDPRGWINRIEHRDAAGQPLPNTTLVFTRDAAGLVTALQDGPDEVTYDYDLAGQLTRVTRNGSPSETYTYDINGNRRSSHRQASTTTTAGNRLTRAGDWFLTYDGEGNLTTKSNSVTGLTFSLSWDHRNRLSEVQRHEPGAPVEHLVTHFRYDPLDRRIALSRDGQTTWTYYDGAQPIADFHDAETTPAAVYLSGEGLDQWIAAWRRDEGEYWILSDHLGSVRWLTQTNGTEVARYTYEAFGSPLIAAGTRPEAAGRLGFTGREWDAETALYYFRARYYDPELGRFISRDPLGFDAGDPNLYRYAGNNPVNVVDPTGRLGMLEFVVINEALLTGIILPSVGELATIGCRSALLFTEIAETLATGDTQYDNNAWWECAQ